MHLVYLLKQMGIQWSIVKKFCLKNDGIILLPNGGATSGTLDAYPNPFFFFGAVVVFEVGLSKGALNAINDNHFEATRQL